MKTEQSGVAYVPQDTLDQSKMTLTWIMHVEACLLNGIG
jgi:hypothetical protein